MKDLYDINLEGIGKVNGGIYKNIKISGIGSILSDVKAEFIKVEGVCNAKGNVNCTNISIDGKFDCTGSIDVDDKILINGLTKVNGNFQGKEAYVDGKLDVKGLLSCDKIKILISGRNKINELGGECITILAGKKNFISDIVMPNKLISNFIEGDIIVLENTVCDMVRGHNITIKGNCNIKTIEYSGEVNIDEKSCVENIIKI